MNIAAVLRELMAAGLSGEALVEAVERGEPVKGGCVNITLGS